MESMVTSNGLENDLFVTLFWAIRQKTLTRPFPVGTVPLKKRFIMTKHILFTAALGGLVSFSAEAQDRGPREADPRQNMREALIKKFDKNGDGKLDENERPSREQLQEFFRSQLGDRPSGRPGEGRPGGRPGEGGAGGRGGDARPNMRAAFIKKFDKNGDGRVDENERPSREEAMAFFRSMQDGDRPGGGSRPGQSGRPGEGGRPGQGGRPGEGGRPEFGGGRPSMNPVMAALDANRDGEISAAEIKNAAAALSKLDKNKDGKITRDEIRPSSSGFGGDRPGGFGRPGQRPGGERPDRPDRPGGGFNRPDRPDRPGGGFDRPGRPGQRPGGDRPGRPTPRPDRPTDRRSDA